MFRSKHLQHFFLLNPDPNSIQQWEPLASMLLLQGFVFQSYPSINLWMEPFQEITYGFAGGNALLPIFSDLKRI